MNKKVKHHLPSLWWVSPFYEISLDNKVKHHLALLWWVSLLSVWPTNGDLRDIYLKHWFTYSSCYCKEIVPSLATRENVWVQYHIACTIKACYIQACYIDGYSILFYIWKLKWMILSIHHAILNMMQICLKKGICITVYDACFPIICTRHVLHIY